ncbi:MAG: flagellar basal-body rod protein FlgF [Thermodesulfovibrionales bacterium]
MYKGIYIALSGATLKHTQLDIISQNLANANTLGFKRSDISFKDYLLQSLEEPGARVMADISGVATDFSEGELVKTGNPLDVALEGRGFISLEGGRYTRRGDLKVDEAGHLATATGARVLGESGPIIVPKGKVEIGSSGEVSVDGVQVGKIKVVDFKDPGALRKGEEYFYSTEQGVESSAGVKQGYLETSNVDTIREMTRMISTLREFEAFQKAITAFDEATSKVTNDMGRL